MSQEEQGEDTTEREIETTTEMEIDTDTATYFQNGFETMVDPFVPETIEKRFVDYDLNKKKRVKLVIPMQNKAGQTGTIQSQKIDNETTPKHDLTEQKVGDVTYVNDDTNEKMLNGDHSTAEGTGAEEPTERFPERFQLTGIVEIRESEDCVIGDYENKVIRIISNDYKTLSQCRCIFQPWDIAVLDPTLLVVSFPFVRLLQLFKVRSKKQLAPWYPLVSGNEYYGIVYERGHVIAACLYDDSGTGPCVHVMNKEGTLQNKISKDRDGMNLFTEPTYIAVDVNSHRIYVLDQGNQSVVSFTRNGEELLVLSHVCDDPSGLAVDSTKGTVFVGDRSARSVLVLNDSLQVTQIVKARDDDAWIPLSLRWCDRSDRLLATMENSSKLRVFRL